MFKLLRKYFLTKSLILFLMRHCRNLWLPASRRAHVEKHGDNFDVNVMQKTSFLSIIDSIRFRSCKSWSCFGVSCHCRLCMHRKVIVCKWAYFPSFHDVVGFVHWDTCSLALIKSVCWNSWGIYEQIFLQINF